MFPHYHMTCLLREHFRNYIMSTLSPVADCNDLPLNRFYVGVEASWCWEKKSVRDLQEGEWRLEFGLRPEINI